MVFRSRTVVMLVITALVFGVFLTQGIDSLSSLINPDRQNLNHVTLKPEDHLSSKPLWEESGLTTEQLNKIASTYYLINERFYKEMDPAQIIDGAINGMLSALDDPYTVYMDEQEAKYFNETVIDSSFSGIGAEVTLEDGKVTVITPIKGSPAEKAGIHARDQILSVNGEKLEGLTLNESVAKIRGPKGTQAKLEVLREGKTDAVEIIVVRDDIDLETVFGTMLNDQIGKIEIRRFSQNTAVRFHKDLAELEAKGMKALVIDVRNNPGGILQTVIELLEPLIPSGKAIVHTEDRAGKRESSLSQKGKGKDYPIVVLTNNGSASASEILAAAIQESTNNIIIGENTYGKGTVQQPFDMGGKDGSNVKMTIMKWLTPDGNFIHEVGVKPNIVVAQPDYFRTTPLPNDKTLKFDMLGSDVSNLQIMLNGLGLKVDRTDGYFSESTRVAVESFQATHELTVNGQVDEPTAKKLEQAIIKEILKQENDLQLSKAIEHLTKLLKK